MGLQVPYDSVEKVRSQYQMEDDMASENSDSLPLKVDAAIQEHLSHKAYLVRSHYLIRTYNNYVVEID